jgi:hypothetical protein
LIALVSARSLLAGAVVAFTFVGLSLAASAHEYEIIPKLQAEIGDKEPYFHTEMYAELGVGASALDWLDRAFRSRDPNLMDLRADDSMATLRQQLRFQAVERALKFPPQ